MKGHSYYIPEGNPIAALVRQLWREQYFVVTQAIKLYGREGVRLVDFSRWQRALIERAEPLFRRYMLEGEQNFDQHVRQIKRSNISPVPLQPFKRTNDPEHVNQYLDVVDPNVAEAARKWTYAFAESTLETTQLKIQEAYDQTKYVVSEGLKENLNLEQLTQLVGMIFNDEKRAKRIAATEASRMYHLGQLKTAKQSGKITSKTWRANANACDACKQLNGKTVGLDEPFEVVGSGAYGVIDNPPFHPHCLCSVSYGVSPVATADEYFTEPHRQTRPDYFAVEANEANATDAYFTLEEYRSPAERYKW